MENEKKTDIPELSIALISRLNSKNIRYCHWKSNEHLMAGLCGKTDLDILVGKQQRNRFIEILTDLKFIQLRSQFTQSFNGVEDWLGLCFETGITLHLHIHYQLVTGAKFVKEYLLPWCDYVLDTSIKDDYFGMKITDPSIEILLLILRIAIKAKRKTLLKAFIRRKVPYSKDVQN